MKSKKTVKAHVGDLVEYWWDNDDGPHKGIVTASPRAATVCNGCWELNTDLIIGAERIKKILQRYAVDPKLIRILRSQ